MTTLYVIQNQFGLYWGKQSEWLSPSQASQILHSQHKDEMLNNLIELNTKDINIRAKVLAVPTNDKNQPICPEQNTQLQANNKPETDTNLDISQ